MWQRLRHVSLKETRVMHTSNSKGKEFEKQKGTLKTRSGIAGRKFDASKGIVVVSQLKARTIAFPGGTAQEAWRFGIFRQQSWNVNFP